MHNKNEFNKKQIRTEYDSEIKGYWFSAVDLVVALTDAENNQARKNWNMIKTRNSQLSSFCGQLKMIAKDGKFRLTDVLTKDGVIELASVVKYANTSTLLQWLKLFDVSKKYVLKHKDIDVLEVELDEDGFLKELGAVITPEHLPIGTFVKGTLDKKTLKEWWKGRTIPASRDNLREFLDKFDMHFPQQLLEKSFGLSLSDQYWICPIAEELKWSDINFFQNDFSEDVGNILFGNLEIDDINAISLLSPDNTSDGMLKKKWKIIGGKRCLIKGGNSALHQEVANEVLASLICERLDIPYVEYTITEIDGNKYSVCEDFIDGDTELVTAWHIKTLIKKDNNVSDYDNFIKKCLELGINDIKLRLDQMIVLDFIIANTDRHYNNFGLIRDVNNLKWIGFAPIYDSGTSMWCKELTEAIKPLSDKIESKPFRTKQSKQIELVEDYSWLDLDKLNNIEEEYEKTLKIVLGTDNDMDLRINKLKNALRQRIELLRNII